MTFGGFVRPFIYKVKFKSSSTFQIAEIHGIGIKNIRSVDLSYFEQKFGVHKGLCQICSAHFKTTRKRPQNSTLTTDYLTKNRIVTINHSPHSPDMAPCTFYLFGKLHLAMKGKCYANVDAIQKASTAILNAISKNDLKKSSDNLLDRANRCIQSEGNYFEGDQ